MLRNRNSMLGAVARPRTALALIAATIMLGGTISEASAKSRHHHHRHHGHHHAQRVIKAPVLDANASIPSLFETTVQAPVRAIANGVGRSFAGMASFYGSESGSRTASGQRFNQGAMTAAHRSLPFGTKLRVTHAGRSVVVTINDRGPFIRGRVLDLSKGAASVIGLTSRGVGRVVAEVM
ncbi:septal ring lytic transglycosylase RlpA family protein [Tardiphaga sp. vice352]|uniref:septal ring lytic transglycosylase RlpA family protein n=1 Tax=unclassified Tardiphaga TaxID=2631404 RepID=UPI001161EB15|nr:MULTISPECIES: septal ring lytic transglycosylase RlpA family protein [unclassified Tardiphaga]QDM14919.1 septal ring lytic transglycosylase RlpA family protein [Tardiphaga sp. vice278]QDM20026.1 septal ring lytic transglycosylase RlpA family protein [Tardiphaga sp. vice154]QDM25099.1 septal ring lytic transglycosylase RlpA family protein [Tardiphaga sp. vice304]QDM30310.1 septal ring lytic transglycosylase RlpA family protein [Tardiphaga sp. vice352]